MDMSTSELLNLRLREQCGRGGGGDSKRHCCKSAVKQYPRKGCINKTGTIAKISGPFNVEGSISQTKHYRELLTSGRRKLGLSHR